eukprot:TRINITY_DN9622_c0_g1_i1.p1 TRINITY_DN9622_c0_g1~~TRINITY_DN9622_c0_g1_i1.p1  ORF type:complete len:921 (+),score=201.80 TRINITY_DN9622_c0_g1_i1:302-2764(+)
MDGQQSPYRVGDVKYHLGHEATFAFQRSNRKRVDPNKRADPGQVEYVNLRLFPNPSHLEAVNPVILGYTRAQQTMIRDDQRRKVMALLIHGDAAFAGLGSVHEALQLSRLDAYSTGGTIHVVINNQVGYTTPPTQAFSSGHATDIAKAAQAPIFHVNADDPEAVCEACHRAAEWRDEFGSDVVIDIVGYRRFGHNEQDDPSVTLPVTYRAIRDHPSVLAKYTDKCFDDNTVTGAQMERWQQGFGRRFQLELDRAGTGIYNETSMDYARSTMEKSGVLDARRGAQELTGLPLDTLQFVGRAACDLSEEDIHLHPSIKSLMSKRLKMVKSADSRVDWAMAEALAMGTLALHRDTGPGGDFDHNTDPQRAALQGLNKGHFLVRLSGQDAERGTFASRHASVYDQDTGQRYVRLSNIAPGGQDEVEIANSPLNEFASLGFEYGVSLGFQNEALVMWEAQFGDFANNAQVMIDQFIASGEARWDIQSGLVLLLPHGYDGQGPDHSSARMERFLQMVNDDPDFVTGRDPNSRRLIDLTLEALGADKDADFIERSKLLKVMMEVVDNPGEAMETLFTEMCLSQSDTLIPRLSWEAFMTSFLRRHAERSINMFVVNCSTPAQYFHALRRQVNLPFRKPLIMFTPKWLLHHGPCTSALKDFGPGTFFNRIITDMKNADNFRHITVPDGVPLLVPDEQVERVILCTGQVFYHLNRIRLRQKYHNVRLTRLEQIAPFPHDLLVQALQRHPHAEVVWVQEEPRNMGAWSYVRPRLNLALREESMKTSDTVPPEPRYIGRPVSASAATASSRLHKEELDHILHMAFEGIKPCQ